MRLLKHLFAPSAGSQFPAATLDRIADAITANERLHRGEICFAVESALHWRDVLADVDSRGRAEATFGALGVWDTEANNGVLIYLLLADHRLEIVADRGLDALVSPEQWRGVAQMMEERLRAGEAEAAVLASIDEIGRILAEHFPQHDDRPDVDELPNRPVILR